MAMNPLPPQAYTKDTLLQAYQWLQNQNEGIKQLATSPDILVSLFLKAKLNGDQFLDRPSIQNFKSELKALSGLMGELDKGPSPQLEPAPSTQMQSSSQASAHLQQQTLTGGQSSSSSHAVEVLSKLDARSLEAIRNVQHTLNLSSEIEALRLIIAVGSKNLLLL